MKRSVFARAFGGYVLLLVALSSLFILFSFRTIRKHYLDTLARELENMARLASTRVLPDLEEARLENLNAYLREEGKKIRTRMTVINPEGVVQADSEEDPKTMESHRFRPEVDEALQGRIGRSLRYSSTVKEEMLYVALPLEEKGKIVGALRLSLHIRDINVLLSAMRSDIGRAAVIIIVLSLIIAFFFASSLTRPVRMFARASQRVAAGDFEAKVQLRRRDEWHDFARSFNAMTEELRELFADLRHRKEELVNIMASMQEGLLVLDRDDRIALSNQSAKDMLQNPALEGKTYWEIIRTTSFVELVGKARKERKGQCGEVSLAEKNYLCSVSFLPSQERVVVTMNDVTEIRNWARMKKDLVVNVSHELRTPLTAIKGFAEALEDEVEEKGKNYAQAILRSTHRLIRIVEDLLSLSELEERGLKLEAEKVNLGELAGNILRTFEPQAREKNLMLRFDPEPGLPLLDGDSFRLEQMLVDLIDNAVKYTEKGEIAVSLKKKEDQLVIEVSDTGIGIPEEDQSRVFERFYVVDKSRSRKMGGTGLGLSIVKHIALLHGGRIRLESKPGVGSKFIITLPLVLTQPDLGESSR